MKKTYSLLRTLVLSLATLFSSLAGATLPKWSYDAGPNPNTKMGKELIDLTADIPNMPEISYSITGKQKFRPAFGPIPWRMLLGKNKVKMLFIGQDGTHIAEAAGRPATAGFGGRAQDLANYFGVDESAAFINTYALTIKGQYGAYETPYVQEKSNGELAIYKSNLVDNQLWMMSMDQKSPIVKWRNNLIDWIIRNNKDSMKLIVTFGGAARDSIATFIESKGGEVGTRLGNKASKVQVAETKLQYAGGNNQFPVPVDYKGRDLYAKLAGRKLDYKKASDQALAKFMLTERQEELLEQMIFTKGGPDQNGLLHPAQLGGYDMNKAYINGIKTISLKGLELNDGTKIKNNILVVKLPHPSYLSRLSKDEASATVARDLKALAKYVEAGWEIEADPDQTNNFAAGIPYKYSRADIGPEYYDFGTPGTRMVPVSTASRMSGNANVIVFGTRDRAKYDMTKIKAMTNAKPGNDFSDEELFIARPRSAELRYVFDAGPGTKYAKMMKENLNLKEIFKAKEGMSFKNDGIDAYNVKNHPEIADFGHYRGTFKNPRVLVVADPKGYDDLITARALTGTRGQYLQSVMENIGVNDDYLVIKTVPFGMDGATKDEWKTVLDQTKKYREVLLQDIVKNNDIELILTDGTNAAKEVKRIIKDKEIPVVKIYRRGTSDKYGLSTLTKKIKKIEGFEGAKGSLRLANIPRSHLSFYARTWEGTSGDRVLNASDKYKGLAFAEVAPSWAYTQKTDLKNDSQEDIDLMIQSLEDNNLPLPGESIIEYLDRTNVDPSISYVLAPEFFAA